MLKNDLVYESLSLAVLINKYNVIEQNILPS